MLWNPALLPASTGVPYSGGGSGTAHAAAGKKFGVRLEAELAELEEGAAGTLRLGTNYARARLIIPLFFVQYHARYPKVRLELVPGETSAMERMLENGELDGFLGVNTALRPGMKSVPLAQESIYLIASVSYLKKYLGLEKEAIAGLRSGIDLKHFQGLPFAMNYGKSTAFQLIDQHLVTKWGDDRQSVVSQ